MQQVLHYSALKTGVAYVALTLVDHRLLRRRAGAGDARRHPAACCRSGCCSRRAALVLYAQLPVHGHYFWDLFPAFILSGIGLALAFVPMSIGALTGVPAVRRRRRVGADQHEPADRRCDRRRASRRRSRRRSRATTSTRIAGATASSGAALTHGFAITFYVLAGIAVLGAVVAAVLIEPRERVAAEVDAAELELALEAA